ncbi:MAG: hypothetical protein J0M00_20130 [Burkholderiales bacterium]|nr:hypothetical protein [Burkholderiales bacterium]
MTINTPNTAPLPHRVLRPLWFEGKFRKAGDVIKLPRQLAAELRAADKVELVEAKPATSPAKPADSKPEGDGQPS